MDCACIQRWWLKCATCLYAYCEKHQCRCTSDTLPGGEQVLPAVDEISPVAEDSERELDEQQEQMRMGYESDKLRVSEENGSATGVLSKKAQGKQKAVTWEE